MSDELLRGRRTKSYGSLTSSLSVRQKRIEHRVEPGETLAGLALKYGVTMEQIKRANRLYTNDSIFLKRFLYIPVLAESLSFTHENEPHDQESSQTNSDSYWIPKQNGTTNSERSKVPADLSPLDYFRRMDSLIHESKQAAVKTCQTGEKQFFLIKDLQHSSQNIRTPPSGQQSTLSSVPLTITKHTKKLMDREDEIFQL